MRVQMEEVVELLNHPSPKPCLKGLEWTWGVKSPLDIEVGRAGRLQRPQTRLRVDRLRATCICDAAPQAAPPGDGGCSPRDLQSPPPWPTAQFHLPAQTLESKVPSHCSFSRPEDGSSSSARAAEAFNCLSSPHWKNS